MKAKMIRAMLAESSAAVNKISSRDALSPFGRVRLDVAGGNLSLTGSDGDMQLTWREQCDGEEVGALTVPGARLAAFAGAMPDGVMSLEGQCGEDKRRNEVVLACGDVIYRLACESAEKLPAMVGPKDGAPEVTIPSLTFREMLRKVKFAMATDGRAILRGVNVSLDRDKLEMTATDGKRLAHVEHEMVGGEFDVTLGAKAVGVLWGLLDKENLEDEVSFAADADAAMITAKRWCLTLKVLSDKYPNWRAVVPGNPSHKATIDRVAFLKALGQTALAMEQDGGVKITITDGRVSFSAKSEFAHADTMISGCKVESKDKTKYSFVFNPKLLKDALEAIDEDEFTLGYGWGGANGRVLIKCSLPWVTVVMPMQGK